MERVRRKSHKFYVYEHWRPDTNTCFWVGKGHGKRAYNFYHRNLKHKAIQAELELLSLTVDVKFIEKGLSEDEAFALERKLIAKRRKSGVALANGSNGGEGRSGIIFSAERRAYLSAKGKGRKMSPEARAKMSFAARNRPKEYWDRLSKTLTGRKLSKEHCKKLSLAHLGQKPSNETRAKHSVTMKGHKWRPETLEKRKVAMKAAHARKVALGLPWRGTKLRKALVRSFPENYPAPQ